MGLRGQKETSRAGKKAAGRDGSVFDKRIKELTIKEYNRQYYLRNIEKIREYRRRNRESISERGRQYRIRNRDKILNYGKKWRQDNPNRNYTNKLRRRYGLSQDDFEALLIHNNGRCYLCNRRDTRPCVDHDHETGKVRGILCNACNMLLGWFEKIGARRIKHYLEGG